VYPEIKQTPISANSSLNSVCAIAGVNECCAEAVGRELRTVTVWHPDEVSKSAQFS